MRLTRAQFKAELRTLEAQHKADTAVIARALAEVHRLTLANERLGAAVDELRSHPSLAANVRLAHHLEVAERERDDAQAALRVHESRLADLAQRFPHAFPKGDAA